VALKENKVALRWRYWHTSVDDLNLLSANDVDARTVRLLLLRHSDLKRDEEKMAIGNMYRTVGVQENETYSRDFEPTCVDEVKMAMNRMVLKRLLGHFFDGKHQTTAAFRRIRSHTVADDDVALFEHQTEGTIASMVFDKCQIRDTASEVR